MDAGNAGILLAVVCILLMTFESSREAPFFLERDFLDQLPSRQPFQHTQG